MGNLIMYFQPPVFLQHTARLVPGFLPMMLKPEIYSLGKEINTSGEDEGDKFINVWHW